MEDNKTYLVSYLLLLQDESGSYMSSSNFNSCLMTFLLSRWHLLFREVWILWWRSFKSTPARKKALKSSGITNIFTTSLFNIQCRIYGSFTMESIFSAAFGRVIEIQKGQSDQITDAAAVIFETSHEKKLSSVVVLIMLLSK